MCNFENFSSFCCQGGTWCVICEREGSKSHTSHSFLVRIPTLAYNNIHWQHNHCRNSQSEITITGDTIFLAFWWSFTEIFQIILPTGNGATSRLPYKDHHRLNTHPYMPLLFTYAKFANTYITCSSTCYTARVYWNTNDSYTKGIQLHTRIPISCTPGRDSQVANLVYLRHAPWIGYHILNICVPLPLHLYTRLYV